MTDLRHIDISDATAVKHAPVGDRPELIWVNIADLRIDDRYQRPLARGNWAAITNIANSFDWAQFAPVVVAPLDERTFALIDGQHRAHAAALVGLDQIPAMRANVPVDRQAAAFAAINSQRTAMTPHHMFKAALVAKAPWAVDSDLAVSQAGCRLMTSNRSYKERRPRQVFAVAMVRDHILAGRDQVVIQGLAALAESDRSDEVALYEYKILRPWLGALSMEPGLCKLPLKTFVATHDLVRVQGRVGHMRESPEFAKLSDFELCKRTYLALIHKAVREGVFK